MSEFGLRSHLCSHSRAQQPWRNVVDIDRLLHVSKELSGHWLSDSLSTVGATGQNVIEMCLQHASELVRKQHEADYIKSLETCTTDAAQSAAAAAAANVCVCVCSMPQSWRRSRTRRTTSSPSARVLSTAALCSCCTSRATSSSR